MSALRGQPGSFVFVAAKAAGGRTLGVRQARDRRALAEVLRRERLLLLRSYPLPGWAARERKLKLKDNAELNSQLDHLLSRGVPLVEALEVTEEAVGPAARPIVARMRELVGAGSSFSDACLRVGVFDRVTVAVYRAAERTGDLAGAARQLASTAERQLRVASKTLRLMVYPAVVLAISVALMSLMLTVIVPMIGGALSKLGVDLPWYTRVLIAVGTFLRENIVVVSFAVGAAAIAAIVLRRGVLAAAARLARRAPLVRDVILAAESARFFSVMAAMTRSGVPLADAMGVANEAIGLPALKRQLTTLRSRLIEGGVLRNLIEDVQALPLPTRRLLIAAERSGDMEQVFDGLARDMTDEVDERAELLLNVLEPALIVALFAVVGSMLLAIMIPLITLTQQAI